MVVTLYLCNPQQKVAFHTATCRGNTSPEETTVWVARWKGEIKILAFFIQLGSFCADRLWHALDQGVVYLFKKFASELDMQGS